MSDFNTSWKGSEQPRKQRKYRANAPHHIKGTFLNARVTDRLQDTYGKRARIRTGDTVEVMRGDYQGKEGTVQEVDVERENVYVDGVEVNRKDGTQSMRPVHPSNLKIVRVEEDETRESEDDDDTS